MEYHIEHEDGQLAVYQWGEADKTVLLLHGWSGRGPQLGAFVAPLLEAGYQVVAFDAPGHGQSHSPRQDKSSSIFRMHTALKAVVAKVGPVDAVIAHSFGVMLLAYALRKGGFTCSKAVCISSPTTPVYLVDLLCQYLEIDNKVKQAFLQLVEIRFSPDLWQQISADENVREISIPALIIHDKDDNDVPVQYSQQLADAWRDSTLLVTQGLGHRRILRDRKIIQQTVDFIST